MNRQKTIVYILAGILIFSASGLLISCESAVASPGNNCPYVIEKDEIRLGEISGFSKYVAAVFEVHNASAKTIKAFTVSFCVYDSEGNSPFIGGNTVIARGDYEILPDEGVVFVVSLDNYISVVPEEPYIMDFVYLREILFEDGSRWRDPYGMFALQ